MALRQWVYFNMGLAQTLSSTFQYEMKRPVKPHKNETSWAMALFTVEQFARAHHQLSVMHCHSPQLQSQLALLHRHIIMW